MNFEQSIKPVSPVFLQSDISQFKQNKETFHDIFQRTLNHKSNSRPPKMEITGILVPISKSNRHSWSNFKLETDKNEYVLRMGETVSALAKKMEWEEVTVKGYLDPDEDIFEVERISLSNRHEPSRIFLGPTDFYFELEQLKNAIAKRGLLDVAPDYLAS